MIPPEDENRQKWGRWGKEEGDVTIQRMLYQAQIGLKEQEHKQRTILGNEQVSKQNYPGTFCNSAW